MSETLRLERLRFKAGSAAGQPPLEVTCPHVTILVGPNSAGKSQTLREIEGRCTGIDIPSTLLDDAQITMPDNAATIVKMMEIFRTDAPEGHPNSPEQTWFYRPKTRSHEDELRIQVHNNGFHDWLTHGHTNQLHQYFVRFFTCRLDGRTRFELVDPKPTGPLEKEPENLLWKLFVSDKHRKEIRRFTKSAFGKFFVVDPTGMTKFRVRLSDRRPQTDAEEQALDAAARRFHEKAPVIQSLGDGVQTSVGLVSAVLSLPDRIILIDEPEAFLHPTLARRVGRVLAQAVRDRGASLVMATHSSELLLGCMQSAPDLRIVRLTFEGGIGGARSLEPAEVRQLMNDPLLRSAHALRALFHRGAIVCEADADRAFYEEANARLSVDGRGIEDCLFMNAQNWQTIPRLVQPLRRIGVPALAVFDFDVLMSDDFGALWQLVDLKGRALHRLQDERATLKITMDAVGRKECKAKGLDALLETDRTAARKLLGQFAAYGILFVPVGELENWLKALLPRPVAKPKWLVAIFEAMGADPNDANYLQAGTGDVWEFLETARRWIDNANRRGMPA